MRAVGFAIGAGTAAAVALVVTGAIGFADVPPLAASSHAPHLAVRQGPVEPRSARFATLVRRESERRADARADGRADARTHGQRTS